MTVKESLDKILAGMSKERLREVLDFAEFLQWREERQEWLQFGRRQLARAYGPNEPEYTVADVKPKVPNSTAQSHS